MKNEMTEQTRENVSSELNWIAKTYLSMANEITYTENIEDFIESLLSMETYIDKVVSEDESSVHFQGSKEECLRYLLKQELIKNGITKQQEQ